MCLSTGNIPKNIDTASVKAAIIKCPLFKTKPGCPFDWSCAHTWLPVPPPCSEHVSPFTWTLYHPLLCQHLLFYSLCFSTSLLSRFHLLFSFLHAGQCPRFCSASLPLSPVSALSPPSLQLSLSFLSPCPPICWSCPDNSALFPITPSFSPDVPHSVPYLSDFLQTRSHSFPCPISFPFSLFFSPSIHKTIHSSLIYPSIHSSSQLLCPCSSQPLQTLQQWDQNVGEIEHEPR